MLGVDVGQALVAAFLTTSCPRVFAVTSEGGHARELRRRFDGVKALNVLELGAGSGGWRAATITGVARSLGSLVGRSGETVAAARRTRARAGANHRSARHRT